MASNALLGRTRRLPIVRIGPLHVGDRSRSDEISALFGLSKSAFKRAVGGLRRDPVVRVDGDGYLILSGR